VNTKLAIAKDFSEVAYFNLGNTFFQFFLFIPVAIGMPLTPTIAEEVNNLEKIKNLLEKIMKYLNILLSFLLFPTLLLSPSIIKLIYGKSYLPAVKSFIFILGATIPASIGYIFGYYLTGTGKMWLATFFNAFWFFFFIGLVFSYTYKLGALGAGIGFYVAYLLQAFFMLIYFRNLMPKFKIFIFFLIFTTLLTMLIFKLL